MRQWNGRPQTPAQYDIGRIRTIGEWGQASRHVGARWENVGLDSLRIHVANKEPIGVLAICTDPVLQDTLASTGSKNPDTLLLFEANDAVVVQAADLKWSLDVASYRQISAAVLSDLMAQSPELVDAIEALLPDALRERPLIPRDGFFYAPRSIANERFLGSPENVRQEYPIEPSEVVLEPIDPFWFFDPLPGWTTAQELARIDGVIRSLPSLDTADRYYHLGAGVAGALFLGSRGVFDDDADVDRTGELDRLREFVSTISPRSTGVILDRLGIAMRQRQALLKGLRDLPRSAFTFKDFVGELIDAGRATEFEIEPDLRKKWSALYWPVVEVQDVENRVVGRRLRNKGLSDVESLDRLTLEKATVTKRMRARARAAIQSQSVPGQV